MKDAGKFEDLEVWKMPDRLCADIYKSFWHSQAFGFRDQNTRSVLSIASNIAEEYEIGRNKEIANFLTMRKFRLED